MYHNNPKMTPDEYRQRAKRYKHKTITPVGQGILPPGRKPQNVIERMWCKIVGRNF